MDGSLLLPLLLSLALASATCFALELRPLQPGPCSMINDFLEEQGVEDDLETNFAAIRQYVKSVPDKLKDDKTIALLEGVASLVKVLSDEEKCKSESYQLLDDVMSECVRLRGSRVHTLINEFQVMHGEKCVEVITHLEPKEYSHLNQVYLSRVHAFTDAAIRSIRANIRWLQPGKIEESKLIAHLVEVPLCKVWPHFNEKDLHPLAADILKSVITADNPNVQDRKAELAKLNFEQVYREFILQPCEHYMTKLSYVFGLWEKNSRYFEVDPLEYADFTFHLYRYELCSYLVRDQARKLYLLLSKEAEAYQNGSSIMNV